METSNDKRWVEEQLEARRAPGDWNPDATAAWTRLSRRRASATARGRTVVWVGAGLCVATTSVLAYPPTRAFAQRCVAACVAGTTQVLSGTPVVRDDRKLAPDFVLKDVDGRELRLSALRGKVVLLNFWATWCNPCRVEVPWFTELQRAYQDRGFTVVGVSFDEEGWEVVRPFLDTMKVNYPVVIGNDTIARDYGGLNSLPTTLILDRNGRIAATHVGLVSKSTYERDIDAALARP